MNDLSVKDPLLEALVELLASLEPDPPALVVAGGYGLVLKARALQDASQRTRRTVRLLRSTNDIDCILTGEIIVDSAATKRIREALDALGYVPRVPNLQFVRTIDYYGQPRDIKFDFLGAEADDRARVHVKDNRIRPHKFSGLHGRRTPEAFAVAEGRIRVEIRTTGVHRFTYVPHPFAYLILKLFALRDRLIDPEEEKYHALDLYTIWAWITKREWDEVIAFRQRFHDHPSMVEARSIVGALFGDRSSPGITALLSEAKRVGLSISSADLGDFITDLTELLTRSSQQR